jgi:hypothetical protein
VEDTGRPFVPTQEIRFGWQQTWSHWKTWLVIGGIGAFLGLVRNTLSHGEGAHPVLGFGVQLIQVALTLVAFRFALALADEKPLPDFDLRALLAGYLPFLLTEVVVGIIIAGGLILLIVPGIYWGLTYGLAPMVCAARKCGVLDALRESRRITVGRRGTLFWFGLLCIGVNVLGALALGVGLLVTIPTTVIATAHVFRRLEALTPHVPAPPPIVHRPLEVGPPPG